MRLGIFEHLDKNNLHHAYLIEGAREEIIPEIFIFMQTLGISTSQNPDFCEIQIDNFKIDEALSLRRMADEKSFTLGHSSTGEASGRKIFIVSAHHFSLDAEHALLKMFEEPIENTHFFLIVPDSNALLKTLVSRFYLIKPEINLKNEIGDAKKFVAMSLNDRINFLKSFLKEEEKGNEDEKEMVSLDSTRSKSLRFLNALETALHDKFKGSFPDMVIRNSPETYFQQIFQVRKFLRQPGSSTKSLMESLALVIPNETRN